MANREVNSNQSAAAQNRGNGQSIRTVTVTDEEKNNSRYISHSHTNNIHNTQNTPIVNTNTTQNTSNSNNQTRSNNSNNNYIDPRQFPNLTADEEKQYYNRQRQQRQGIKTCITCPTKTYNCRTKNGWSSNT